MKKFTTLAVAICLLSFASCADKNDVNNAVTAETPSKIDNKPFKLEEYIAQNVHPGNNMFNYSYGKWVANSSGDFLCDAESSMDAKSKRIGNTPESDKLLQLYAEFNKAAKEGVMFKKDQEILTNYTLILDELNKATKKDEVIKIWAKLLKEGYIMTTILRMGSCERGICLCPHIPVNFPTDQTNAQETNTQSRAVSKLKCNVMDKLMTELGVSPDMVNYQPVYGALIYQLDRKSADDLKTDIIQSLAIFNNLVCPPHSNEGITVHAFYYAKQYARFLDVSQYNPVGLWATQQENDAVIHMTEEIKDALVERIGDLDWMSNTTKHNAINKVKNIVPVVVGAMDMRNQKVFASIAGETLCESFMKMNKGLLNAAISLVGKPRTDTNMYLALEHDLLMSGSNNMREMVNAFYSPSLNSIFICPAYGSYPAVDLSQTEAMLYGGLGTIVGHEMTHSIDKGGASYGIYGESHNWWTDNDYQTFTERAKNVENSYSSMDAIPEFYPTIKNNGLLTLNENIADIGGLSAALTAYKKHLTHQGFKGEEMDKCLRKMFVSAFYALASRCNQEMATLQLGIEDVHSFGETRMGGMCRNIDEWYRLFNVEQQHKLFLSPERRCKIW